MRGLASGGREKMSDSLIMVSEQVPPTPVRRCGLCSVCWPARDERSGAESASGPTADYYNYYYWVIVFSRSTDCLNFSSSFSADRARLPTSRGSPYCESASQRERDGVDCASPVDRLDHPETASRSRRRRRCSLLEKDGEGETATRCVARARGEGSL